MLAAAEQQLPLSQRHARDFWVDMQNVKNLPTYLYVNMKAWRDLSQTFATAGNFEEQFDKFLQNKLKKSTDLKTVVSEFENTKNKDLRFWSGTYFLFNDTGAYDILTIDWKKADEDEIEITVSYKQEEVNVISFEGAVLNFEGKELSGQLQFSIFDSFNMDNKKLADFLDAKHSFSPSCTGSIMPSDGKKQAVYAKKGCYSPEGAKSETLGDSLAFWNGTYSLVEATDKAEIHLKKELTIYTPDGEVSHAFIQWGEQKIPLANVNFYQNFLTWNIGQPTEVAGQFVFERAYTGERKITGTIGIKAEEKLVIGYLTSSLTSNNTPGVPANNLFSAHATLTTTALAITATFPEASNQSTYVPVKLTASGGTAPYTWKKISGNLPKGLDVSSDGFVYGTIQEEPGTYSFEVEAVDANATKSIKGTQRFELKVRAGISPLEIITDRLPDSAKGTTLIYQVKAQGGDPTKYVWSCTESAFGTNIIDSSTGIITIILDKEIGDYKLDIKLVSEAATIEKKLVVRINPVPAVPIAAAGATNALIVACISIVAAAAVAIGIKLHNDAKIEKDKGENDKWNTANEFLKQTAKGAEDALKTKYPGEFSELTKTFDAINVKMQNQQQTSKEYKAYIDSINVDAKHHFNLAIQKARTENLRYTDPQGDKKLISDSLHLDLLIEKMGGGDLNKIKYLEDKISKWEAEAKEATESVDNLNRGKAEHDRRVMEAEAHYA